MFTGGISQGILNYQKQEKEDESQSVDLAYKRQLMALQNLKMEQDKAAQVRDQQARQNMAFTMGGAGNQGPQPPMPGQPSVPMAPLQPPQPPMQQMSPPPIPGHPPGIEQGMGMQPPTPMGQRGMPPAPQQIPPYQTVDGAAQQSQSGSSGLDISKLSPMQQRFLMNKNPEAFSNGVQDFQKTSQGMPPPGMQQNSAPQAPAQPDPAQMLFHGPSALDTAMNNMKAAGVPMDQQLDVISSPQFQSFLSQKDKDRTADLQAQQEARMVGQAAATKAYNEAMMKHQGRADDESVREHNMVNDREKQRIDIARTNAGTGAGTVDPSTVDYYAKQSLAGDNSWQVGLARGKVGQKLISAVKDRIPQMAAEQNLSPEQASARKGQREALNATLKDRTKYTAASNQFVNNFEKQADLVEKYLEPGVGGSTPVFNRWIQAGRKQIAGDTAVNQLDTTIRGLAREHQRIVTGVTSNGQLHDSAQKTADELLNRDMTADNIRGTLKVMREEAKNSRDAGNEEVDFLKNQLEHMGSPSKNSDASSSPSPMPSSKSQLKTGSIYQTSRGPAKWNGTEFEAQ